MENKKNSGSLTIANCIAIVGMALLALFTFFGQLYGSDDGQFGMALLLTILMVALLGSALGLSIYAKSANSDFGVWRIVKYVSLAFYAIVAIAYANPLLNYFRIMSEKDKLQRMALIEIAAIDSMYSGYHHQMKAATQNAAQRLKDYVDKTGNSGWGASTSESMESYINLMKIDRSNIDNWGVRITKVWRVPTDTRLKEMKDGVERWGYFDIDVAQIGAEIKEKAEKTADMLNEKVKKNISKSHIIPVIDLRSNVYVHDGYVEATFNIPEAGRFYDALHGNNGKNIIGWAMFLFLHLLVLLNYVVTLESGVVRRRGGRHDTGISNGIPIGRNLNMP